MNIEEIKKLIGTPYKMFFDDGNYCGCFYPLYKMYPDLPRYPLPTSNPVDNYDYGVDLIKKHAYEIPKNTVKAGDILATIFKKELHVALCIGGDKIIHVFKDHELQQSRFKLFRDRLVKFYRLK